MGGYISSLGRVLEDRLNRVRDQHSAYFDSISGGISTAGSRVASLMSATDAHTKNSVQNAVRREDPNSFIVQLLEDQTAFEAEISSAEERLLENTGTFDIDDDNLRDVAEVLRCLLWEATVAACREKYKL